MKPKKQSIGTLKIKRNRLIDKLWEEIKDNASKTLYKASKENKGTQSTV